MKKIFKILSIFLIGITISCENEVEINDEFIETTVVFGLLNHNADTQFVKVTKTFLDDKKSAIDLAKDGNQLFYDSLTVRLIEEGTDSIIRLIKISRPKEPGIFTSDRNEAYFTTHNIQPNTTYKLEIIKTDGSIVRGETTTIDRVTVSTPNVNSIPQVNNVDFINNNNFNSFVFRFKTRNNVAEFEANTYFYYKEVINGDSVLKRISLPLGRRQNPTLQINQEFSFRVEGQRFFDLIESEVPATPNPTEKVVFFRDNYEIEIFAADEDYNFFRNLNGPIEGLAQVRPEFTNIEGGIGLFASRLTIYEFSKLGQETRDYLVNNYNESRNFIFP